MVLHQMPEAQVDRKYVTTGPLVIITNELPDSVSNGTTARVHSKRALGAYENGQPEAGPMRNAGLNGGSRTRSPQKVIL